MPRRLRHRTINRHKADYIGPRTRKRLYTFRRMDQLMGHLYVICAQMQYSLFQVTTIFAGKPVEISDATHKERVEDYIDSMYAT